MFVSLEARDRMPKGLKELATFDQIVDEKTTAKQDPAAYMCKSCR
jgi:hypothetical protein